MQSISTCAAHASLRIKCYILRWRAHMILSNKKIKFQKRKSFGSLESAKIISNEHLRECRSAKRSVELREELSAWNRRHISPLTSSRIWLFVRQFGLRETTLNSKFVFVRIFHIAKILAYPWGICHCLCWIFLLNAIMRATTTSSLHAEKSGDALLLGVPPTHRLHRYRMSCSVKPEADAPGNSQNKILTANSEVKNRMCGNQTSTRTRL